MSLQRSFQNQYCNFLVYYPVFSYFPRAQRTLHYFLCLSARSRILHLAFINNHHNKFYLSHTVIPKTNQDCWIFILWKFSRCTFVIINKLHHVLVLSIQMPCLNITISMYHLPHDKIVPATSTFQNCDAQSLGLLTPLSLRTTKF